MTNTTHSSALDLHYPPTYPSYLGLLNKDDNDLFHSPVETVDVIVVPAARPAVSIINAAKLAHQTRTPLIVLCSMQASSQGVAKELASYQGLVWYAIDIPKDYNHPLLELEASSAIPQRCLAISDLSMKRNIGLIVGKCIGNRLLFLDDDMTLRATGLHEATRMLKRYPLVGFSPHPDGFPDNSVNFHALRFLNSLAPLTHSTQPVGQHISGNSLLINPQIIASHFPEHIYDEDWLYMYEATSRKQVAMTHVTAHQAPYDPFATTSRATREEFGDIVSQGLYNHLKYPGKDSLVTSQYWEEMIRERRLMLESLYETSLGATEDNSQINEKIAKVRNSLASAIEINDTITPEQCVTYYRVWHEIDVPHWKKRYTSLPACSSIESALDLLGLTPYTVRA